MAPVNEKMKNKNFVTKEAKWKKPYTNTQGVKKKRKWVPEHKVFEGSVKEGQGFAFKRKEKIRHEYNKLLRKEAKKKSESKALYTEEYPEHLRHLYQAEAKKLKQEAWTNRVNRSKMRMKGREEKEEKGEDEGEEETQEQDSIAPPLADEPKSDTADPDPDVTGGSEQTNADAGETVSTPTVERESIPMSNRMKKRLEKKSLHQKTKEELESVKEKRRKKKEEFLKNKQQKEEAIRKYKEKKMHTFQMLSKKTKKGQPNLNLQMEYLLQKIQRTDK